MSFEGLHQDQRRMHEEHRDANMAYCHTVKPRERLNAHSKNKDMTRHYESDGQRSQQIQVCASLHARRLQQPRLSLLWAKHPLLAWDESHGLAGFRRN
jgi:hypothetical protein